MTNFPCLSSLQLEWWRVFFFVSGIMCRRLKLLEKIESSNQNRIKTFGWFCLIICLTMTLWRSQLVCRGQLAVGSACNYRDIYIILVSITGVTALYFLSPIKRLPPRLVSASFPIYLLHPFFNVLFQISFPRYPNIIEIVGIWLLSIAVVLVLIALVKDKFPKVYAICFGGR